MKSENILFTSPDNVELRCKDVGEPDPGQILLQTLVSTVSTGTETRLLGSDLSERPGYPFCPGYSSAAKVIRVGQDVTNLREGDRIYAIVNHRQFDVIDANRDDIVKLPDYIKDEDASWGTLSFITQTAVRRGEHIMGDTAVVIGLGPIGQLIVQYLRVVGLREVLVIDPVQMRLDMAMANGATQAFNGSAADAVEFVKAHTDGKLADVVYDVAGVHVVLPMALKLVRDFGKLVLVSGAKDCNQWHLVEDVQARQLKIVGTHNAKLPPEHSYWTINRQVSLFLEYIHRRRMNVTDLITHRFKPKNAVEVYSVLQEKRDTTIGVIFDWR